MPEKCHKVTFRILIWWYGGSVGSAVTSQHEDPRRPFCQEFTCYLRVGLGFHCIIDELDTHNVGQVV